MTGDPPRTVFDCVIFAQALINPKGPAGSCLKAAESGDCILHVSPFVLQEIRELPGMIDERHGVTPDRVESLIIQVREYAIIISDVPEIYIHPADPKDSAYINLALATQSKLVVSRDRHMLALIDAATPEGRAFVQRFPDLRVLKPVDFLRELDARGRVDQPPESSK